MQIRPGIKIEFELSFNTLNRLLIVRVLENILIIIYKW